MLLVTADVTFGTAGEAGQIEDTAFPSAVMYRIIGMRLHEIFVKSDATGATTDSDLYIKDTDGIDILDGTGVDKLDGNNTSRDLKNLQSHKTVRFL